MHSIFSFPFEPVFGQLFAQRAHGVRCTPLALYPTRRPKTCGCRLMHPVAPQSHSRWGNLPRGVPGPHVPTPKAPIKIKQEHHQKGITMVMGERTNPVNPLTHPHQWALGSAFLLACSCVPWTANHKPLSHD